MTAAEDIELMRAACASAARDPMAMQVREQEKQMRRWAMGEY